MGFDPLTAAFELGKVAIEKIWPDPTKRAEELRKLETLKQEGRLAEMQANVQLMLGQIDVNKIEAASDSLFKSGWRPAVGWTTAIVLACAYIPKTVVITVLWGIQAYACVSSGGTSLPVFPDLGIMEIIGLLGSMLGIGAMRTIDKKVIR